MHVKLLSLQLPEMLQNPGFIGLGSESEIDSVSDDRRDEVRNIRRDAWYGSG